MATHEHDSAISKQYMCANRILNFRSLERIQHAHALAAHLVPLAGLLVGIWAALFVHGVPMSILIMAGLFFSVVGLGGSVGYHRYFTHRSFKTGVRVRLGLAILGSMAAQGPVVFWVSLHRMHHEFTDVAGDPHSPNLHGTSPWERLQGWWHAWFGWTTKHPIPNANFYAKDLLRDRKLMLVNRLYYLWVVVGLLLPALFGWLLEHTTQGAAYGLIWGGFARIFAWHQMIYCITCIAHVSGRRDFDSSDLSKNNVWLAIPTLGESWHNNHHAFPQAATLAFRRGQLDISGAVIRLLERIGLVWDVYRPSAEQLSAHQMIRV